MFNIYSLTLVFLQEIFLFEPVHIDETFISSIVMDIARGMKYIHKTSQIGVHGNLKSSNCLVTGRWVVKLSAFGLTDIRAKYRKDRGTLVSNRQSIHTCTLHHGTHGIENCMNLTARISGCVSLTDHFI